MELKKLNIKKIKQMIKLNVNFIIEKTNELRYSFYFNDGGISVIKFNGSYGFEKNLFEVGFLFYSDKPMEVCGNLNGRQVENILKSVELYGINYTYENINDIKNNDGILYEV